LSILALRLSGASDGIYETAPHLCVYALGNRIREVLKDREMTVTDFAESLSCNRQNVYKIFNKHDINTDLLMHIADILDHDFFGEISRETRKCR